MASSFANPVVIKLKKFTKPIRSSIVDSTTYQKKKREFLRKYKSPTGKNGYKRYLGSPLRYAGGKSLAVGILVELLPDNLKTIVSPFFGGGSFEIACSKELGLEVIGYDIFDLLVNYRQHQIKDPIGLADKLGEFRPTREGYLEVKEILKSHRKGEKVLNNHFELAALYYFNHNTSYGPHVLGWPSSVYLQEKRYQTMREKVSSFDPGNLNVYCEDFFEIMDKHKADFLYCDPPYYLDGDSKTFVGLYPHRNFPIHHNGFNHEGLRDFLKKHKGGFILSYNDCTTIREWYKEFDMITPSWQYTFSQGDTRIGQNRLNNNKGSHVKKSHEVIFYKLPSN